jgi:hypothetical protein
LLACFCWRGLAAAPQRTPFQARCEARQLGWTRDSRPTGIRIESHDSGYRVDNSLSYRTLTRMKHERAGGLCAGADARRVARGDQHRGRDRLPSPDRLKNACCRRSA